MKTKLFSFPSVFGFKRGKRLVKDDQAAGNVAYISSKKDNNGIDNFISPPEDMIVYNNKMTLSNSGSVGILFYHDYDFVASDHVTVIWVKDESITLTGNIALYLKPIIESMKYKYNFGREISDARLGKEFIELPVKEDDSPDWEYMNDEICEIINRMKFESVRSKNSTGEFNVDCWGKFKIGKLFPRLESGKCDNAGRLIDGDDLFYIGAKKKDQGVIKRVSYNEELASEGNCMAFICDGDGSVGYSNFIDFDEIIATVNVMLGYNPFINKYVGLFIATVLDLERTKYSFGRKYRSHVANTEIRLPQTIDGKPDYEYMENYILSARFGDRI
ncbi:MAG: restriction endonuclease subunit S [Clostridiales Family XIII bacterium]|jgi:hypothetical protein|nr:restriction endonuclease subunit S [Clostridiales Family XIII bacterium]